MTKQTYTMLENYMSSCMTDSAHDKEHIYRVLYKALEIAEEESEVDYDVLITACLLHDIGRREQFENPKVCHAEAGAKKAYAFLTEHGFEGDFAKKVSDCIRTHRYRKENRPESIEAKILFDADKIDVAGAVGIARTLVYKGEVGEPLYTLTEEGLVSGGEGDQEPSFFQEYKFKLEGLYAGFLTKKGAEIARGRQKAAEDFYNNMLKEVSEAYRTGRELLGQVIMTETEKPSER